MENEVNADSNTAPGRLTPHREDVERVIASLRSDPDNGLTSEEVGRRLKEIGRNELVAEAPVPGWKKFLAQFKDVLVVLLLIATTISAGLWLMERNSALP